MNDRSVGTNDTNGVSIGRRLPGRLAGAIDLRCGFICREVVLSAVSGVFFISALAHGAEKRVHLDEFDLSCPASVNEGGTAACTLKYSGTEAKNWPVAGILHLSSDANRALVRGSPLDLQLATPDPSSEIDGGLWWIGSVLIAYSRFDWEGEASTQASRTVSITIQDDDDYEGEEVFYVSLAASGSRGVGFLYTNRQAITISASDSKSSDAQLQELAIMTDAGEVPLNFAAGTISYAATVAYRATEAVVTPVANHKRATITVNGTRVESGEASRAVSLGMDGTTIDVVVTAENGTTRTYRIVVTRQPRPENVQLEAEGFTLVCPSTVTEGASISCTLANTRVPAAEWPVVAIIHSSVDGDARALIEKDPLIPNSSPAFGVDLSLSETQTPARENYKHGYGELFSGGSTSVYTTYGYQKFDWAGQGASSAERSVVIQTMADDEVESAEIFYIAVAPSGYTGLSQLVDNKAPIMIERNEPPDTTPRTEVDGVKPELAATGGAVVNGATLTLTYTETLDSSSTPLPGAFIVLGGASSRTVSNVVVRGSAVDLTLTPLVAHGETGIRVSYTVPAGPGATPLQDLAGNDAEGLSGEPVMNNTADTTAPRVSSNIETILRKAPTSEHTNADTLTWLITFTEPVRNVDPTDFVVAGTTATLTVEPLGLDEEGCSQQWDATLSGGDLGGLSATVMLTVSDDQDIWGCLGDGEAMTHPGPNGANENTFVVAQGSVATDKAALEALYDATDGANWTTSMNWKTAQPLSEWDGITTDTDGRVTRLSLPGNQLTGTISVALEQLEKLEQLNLSGNGDLTGEIPDGLRHLSLTSLDVSGTNVCTPEDAAFLEWVPTITFQPGGCGTVSPPRPPGGGGGGGGGPRTSAPGAPRNLTVVGGDGQVVLTWDAPSSDGGAEITDYEYRINRSGPWISTGSTETTHTVTGLDNGTAYTFEVRAVNRVSKGRGSNRTEATAVAPETLDFAHFANGDGTTSDLVFVNVASQPVRPALYFYDTEGALVSAESVVDITGDLAIQEDGALTVLTEMEPLGELTILTHGQGELVSGSVRVVAFGSIGGVLRFNLPGIGVAGVGVSLPVRDAVFPVRRQETGINTGVAIHNLESSPGIVRCELMQEGVLRDAASIPLAANGQTSWFIDGRFPGTDTSDFAGSVRCDAEGPGMFTTVALELDAVNRIFTTLPVLPTRRAGGRAAELHFAHFANGEGITSDLVFVNLSTERSRPAPTPFHSDILPARPAIYFYGTDGQPMPARSVVDITGDLEVMEDGGLTVLTEMEPLGVLTISTHGRGELVSGSVRVAADEPIGGVLRFDLPGIGVAGVGASQPVRDALFPVRRQEGGINTGVAVHNLDEEAMEVTCELMQGGTVLDDVSIPLAANGQTSWFINEVFTGADTSDFLGSVRCAAPEEGMFTGVALELDAVNQIFTTLPVVPVEERMDRE